MLKQNLQEKECAIREQRTKVPISTELGTTEYMKLIDSGCFAHKKVACQNKEKKMFRT
jgi:hypothetical protein